MQNSSMVFILTKVKVYLFLECPGPEGGGGGGGLLSLGGRGGPLPLVPNFPDSAADWYSIWLLVIGNVAELPFDGNCEFWIE